MTLPRVVLKPKRAQPFFARHPWVFAGAIERVEGEPVDGAEVELVSQAGHFIAQDSSTVRARFASGSTVGFRTNLWIEHFFVTALRRPFASGKRLVCADRIRVAGSYSVNRTSSQAAPSMSMQAG